MPEAMGVFVAQFLYIFLLGFQQLNVVGKHYAAAAGTSGLLGVFGYYLTATVALHAEQHAGSIVWWAYITAGPVGIVFAMWIHPKMQSWGTHSSTTKDTAT